MSAVSIIEIIGGSIVAAVGIVVSAVGLTLTPLTIGIPLGVAGAGIVSVGAGNIISGIGELVDPHTPVALGQTLYGTEGNDVLTGTEWADKIYGLGGDDYLRGHGGDDVLNGDRGDDTLEGEEGDDQLSGSLGSDKLYGGNGNDSLSGDLDRDILNGGNGDDTLNGGSGRDTFLFYTMDDDTSVDVIEDFELGIDRLEIPRVTDLWHREVFRKDTLSKYFFVHPDAQSGDVRVEISLNGNYEHRLIALLKDPTGSMSKVDDLEYKVILEFNTR